MQTTLIKAIGASPNMNINQIKAKWDAASPDVKAQAQNIGTLIAAVVSLSAVITTAMSAITSAQNALNVALAIPMLPPNPAALPEISLKAVESSASVAVDDFSASENNLIEQMMNITVEV